MKLKRILSAAFTTRNLILLSGVMLITYLTEYPPFFLVGLAGYLYFVMQTLKSESFMKESLNIDKVEDLRQLSRQCDSLYNQLSGELDKNVRAKLKAIIEEKDELMNFFISRKNDYIKQKITEQSLNLVAAYIKLVYNYALRRRDLGAIDINDIAYRLDRNKKQLQHVNDTIAHDELSKSVKMDEDLLNEVNEERRDLERVFARLEYIESAINTFKHKIISKDETDPEIKEIEAVINEASALDSVLNSNDRNRLKQ